MLGVVVFGGVQKIPMAKLAGIKTWWWALICLGTAVYASWAGGSNNGVYGWFSMLGIPFRVGDVFVLLHLMLLVSAYFYDQEKFHGQHFPKFVLLIQLSAWIFTNYFIDRSAFVVFFLTSMFVLLALGRYGAFWSISGIYLALTTLYLLTAKYALMRLAYIRNTLLLSRPDDVSYQFILSIDKMVSGRWWGQWDYLTVETGQHLPEAHLGFSFAYFVQNAGLVGTILLMAFLLALLVIAVKQLNGMMLTYPAVLTLAFCGMYSIQCLIGMSTAAALFPGNNIGIPIFSLHPIKTLGAFITFGLLYRQLASVRIVPDWKECMTKPVILTSFWGFALVILKLTYHLVNRPA